jgi:hypothetical protein
MAEYLNLVCSTTIDVSLGEKVVSPAALRGLVRRPPSTPVYCHPWALEGFNPQDYVFPPIL